MFNSYFCLLLRRKDSSKKTNRSCKIVFEQETNLNEKSFDFLSLRFFPFSKSWPKWTVYYCEIWWYMLISYDERVYCCVIPKLSTKVFIIANPQVHLKSGFQSLKTKWASHTLKSQIHLWLHRGSLNFPGLARFCCYVQNQVMKLDYLPNPQWFLWTKKLLKTQSHTYHNTIIHLTECNHL